MPLVIIIFIVFVISVFSLCLSFDKYDNPSCAPLVFILFIWTALGAWIWSYYHTYPYDEVIKKNTQYTVSILDGKPIIFIDEAPVNCYDFMKVKSEKDILKEGDILECNQTIWPLHLFIEPFNCKDVKWKKHEL